MKAYVINLAHRTDRWKSVEFQSSFLPVAVERFDASDASIFAGLDSSYLPPAVLACFDSHRKLLAEFLKSDDKYALILEDDFLLKKPIKLDYFNQLLNYNLDFLQIGFLQTTVFQSISIANQNFFDLIYKFGAKISTFRVPSTLTKFLSSKLLFSEQIDIPLNIVLHDVRPGTHAYLISRKLALAIQEINSPTFLSADGLYIALGPLRHFKMGRLRRSKIFQSNSPSSIL